jgi:hypothetical protein
VVPADYPIPDDGPVGDLLTAFGRHPWRPAHVHFRLAAEGHHELITHLFLPGSPYLESDAVFGVKEELIQPVEQTDDGPILRYGFTLARFDLERALILSVTDVEPTYTIEEAAERTGISAHTLRYYERIGLLEPVGRASSGHRRYGPNDLGSIEFLTLLRQTACPSGTCSASSS